MSTIVNPNKALCEKGDFTRIAESMRESGEALVASLGITPGLEVLDVGCGDGTTAVPAEKISFERDTYTFDFSSTPSEFVGLFRAYYGPTMNAFEAAAANGRENDLQAELETLFNAQNTSASESRAGPRTDHQRRPPRARMARKRTTAHPPTATVAIEAPTRNVIMCPCAAARDRSVSGSRDRSARRRA